MWKNLAPDLVRQRVIIEGTTEKIVEPDQIKSYLLELAKVTNMEVLAEPEAHSAHNMGYGGWIHWKSSGAAFYSYPTNPPPLYGRLLHLQTIFCRGGRRIYPKIF